MEVNILTFNKKTLNSGHVIFENSKKAKKFKSLIPEKIGTSDVICIEKGKTYYGIKMFYTKKHVMELAKIFKEVLLIRE